MNDGRRVCSTMEWSSRVWRCVFEGIVVKMSIADIGRFAEWLVGV